MADPRSWTAWVVGGLLLLIQLSAWALATPIFAGPDEPAHTFWADAVIRGDLSGEEVSGDPDRREVLVSPSVVALGYPCFAFQPDVPASCEERAAPGVEPVMVGTQAARYPPAYYALVGAPLLADAGAASVYGTRLLTALLVALLLTWALWSLRGDRGPYLATGVGLALTPMVLFTSSIINPSSLEVAANLALWLAGIGLVIGTRDRDVGARTAVAGAAGAVLALARPMSVGWLALTWVALLLLAGRERLRSLAVRRATWGWVAVVTAAVAAALAWMAWSGFLTTATTGAGEPVALGAALRDSVMEADDDIAQLFGGFGWLDTPLATGVRHLWLLLVGGILLLALSADDRRSPFVLLGMVAALVAVPTVLQAVVLGTEGFLWQGRYSLPLAVGIPVVAGAVAARDRPLAPSRARRWLGWVLGLVWLGHVVAFTGTLRRYVVGIDGPYPGIGGGPWQPPLGGWILTALFACASAGFLVWLWSTIGRPVEDGPGSPVVPSG